MMPLLYELAGGRLFFIALGLLVTAGWALAFQDRRSIRTAAAMVAAMAVVVLLLTSLPQPTGFVVLLWTTLIGWAAMWISATAWDWPGRLAPPLLLTAGMLILAVAEGNHQRFLGLGDRRFDRVMIIGDSLAAGIGGIGEQTWPKLLHQRHAVEVVDASMAGARVRDALEKQAPLLGDGAGLVILEIGGNDMFSRVPLALFEERLSALVEQVMSPGRAVVMFELPSLSIHGRYAAVQRRVARRHGVVLIPRRHLIRVLVPADATSDGVHLTEAGHARMAEVLGELIGPHLSPSDVAAHRKVEPAPRR